MKHPWLPLGSMIAIAAGVVLLYLLSIQFEFPLVWILTLYLSSTILTLWMTIRILKDPYSTDKTFDDYFYQDRDDLRRNGKE